MATTSTAPKEPTMPAKKRAPRRRFGSIRQRGRTFQARFKGLDGKDYAQGGFTTRQQAELWLSKEEEAQEQDRKGYTKWLPPEEREERQARAGLTVDDLITEYYEYKKPTLERSTYDSYMKLARNRLNGERAKGINKEAKRFMALPVVDVRKDDAYRWWRGMVKATPNTTRSNTRAYVELRAAFAYATDLEIIDRNPIEIPDATKGKKKRTKDYYLPTDEEIQDILNNVAEEYKVLASLVFFHGLRIGEALALERKDIEITTEKDGAQHGVIHVRQNSQWIENNRETGEKGYMNLQSTKTEAGKRDVPIMQAHIPFYVTHLEKYAATTPSIARCDTVQGKTTKEVTWLTLAPRGGQYSTTNARDMLKAVARKCNENTGIHPHCGRYWLITRLAEQGAHLKEIGNLLGQEDMQTIYDIYMKVRAGRTTELMDMVNTTLEPTRVASLEKQRKKKNKANKVKKGA
ncbi:tyrosine-type recombinase/integrase [Corynebacterium glucuronolyticum]|uniref:Tyrosine-type recombinase/integrase n=1 Tax=Corynebacterium glucuronolyticum TaxID=39791 RepID=A0AAX1L7R5_9CORY|nr:tyrosine-type recombinase/integrase [Corynebacterium glucuronolyticum]QRP70136.1 tyrosine-type recombinase/integrase [Corynebacterium glucuronolyticum]